MAVIKLHGELAQKFGKSFQLDVQNAAEAVRALIFQLDGFRRYFSEGYYKVRIGKHYVTAKELTLGLYQSVKTNTLIQIIPMVKGAKNFFKKVGMILVGAAIVAASIIAHQYYGVSYGTALMFGSFGASMMMGGISQLLTPTPKIPGIANKTEDELKSKSSAFSGLENLTPQGRPVPIVYGEILTGGIIISQGIETYQVQGQVSDSEESHSENDHDSESSSSWGEA